MQILAQISHFGWWKTTGFPLEEQEQLSKIREYGKTRVGPLNALTWCLTHFMTAL
jgi:hypothetical protein